MLTQIESPHVSRLWLSSPVDLLVAAHLYETLHQTFAEQRVNKVNNRKELFYVSPDQVLEELRAHNVEIVEFRTEAEAEEFRLSSGQEDVRV